MKKTDIANVGVEISSGRTGTATVFFGTTYQGNQKLSFDEIVKKYGTRVWNGDKVFLNQAFDDNGKIYGFASGVGETGEISVGIEKSDIAAISWNGGDWKSI